jgi:CheY-like chemotaxis protein
MEPLNQKDLREKSILVVDDEENLRDAIAFDLKRKGYRVLTAENGSKAFAIIQSEHVDLVISDIRMPGGDGIELLKKSKRHQAALPVFIFITANSDLTEDDAYHFGAEAVFSKPFDRKALLNRITESLAPPEHRWAEQDQASATAVLNINGEKSDCQANVRLGRGGMFVPFTEKPLSAGTVVRFKVILHDSADSAAWSLSGTGRVKWSRTEEAGELKRGCGIEFTHIDDEALEHLMSWIAKNDITAYIPNR